MHQEQYMADVVRLTDGFDGGSVGPKNCLEAVWTLETVRSLGGSRRRSVGRVLCTDRFEGCGGGPTNIFDQLEKRKSFVPVRNRIPFSRY